MKKFIFDILELISMFLIIANILAIWFGITAQILMPYHPCREPYTRGGYLVKPGFEFGCWLGEIPK